MDLKALISNPKQAPISTVLVLGGLAYFVAAELGLVLASLNPHAAPVAPAAGLAVALLMVFGRRAWPAVTLGALAAHLLAGGGLGVALPIAAGETLAALAGQVVLSRHLRWHGEKLPLGTTLGYAAASLLAAVISASIGLESQYVADAIGHTSGVEIWLTWWTGHALGVLLLVPALLSLAGARWRRDGAWKICALFVVTLAVNLIAFLDWRGGVAIFLSFPLVLIAFRWFSPRTGLWLANLVAALWTGATVLGFGPFTGGSENAGLLDVQILVAALAFAAVALADFGSRSSRWIDVVLVSGAALAALVFFASDLNRRSQDTKQFDVLIASAIDELQKRIGTYTDMLRGGASMFAASDSITRAEWEIYVNSIDLIGRYPGVTGMGLVVPVKHGDLNAFKKAMQDDGLPLIAARPVPGGSLNVDEHFLIIREGPENLNKTPIGLDLGSEPKRRSAAIAARDFGVPTMSHSVTLALDDGPRVGFVLFVPSYWANRPIDTVPERRAAFRGWINAPIMADRFFDAAFKRFGGTIQVQVFNGVDTGAPAVFSSFGPPDRARTKAGGPASRETVMMLSGHAFQIAWQPGPAFPSASRSEAPLLSAAVLLIATILSALVANLQSTGARANAIAARMTADLAVSNERFRLTEARLKAAIEAMDSGFALFDADDRLILHNKTFIDAQTQAAFGDPIGHTFEEFVRFNIISHSAGIETGPDTEDWMQRRLEQHRNPSDAPFEMRLSTGQWLQVTERRTNDGGYMGIWADITSIKQAEERLINAINAMSDGFVLYDRDLKMVLCNQPWANYVGYDSPEKVIGCTVQQLLHDFAHAEVTDVSARAEPEAWATRMYQSYLNPPEGAQERQMTDGRWFSVMLRATSDGGRVGIFSDVTALRSAETRLLDAIESINEGFALFDADLRYVQFNQRLLELYPNSAPAIAVGAKLEDVLRYGAENGEFPEVTDPTQIDTFVRDWVNCFKRREPFVGEELFADGRWVLISHRPTADGGFVSIRSDITAQKTREMDLQAAKTQLEGLTESLIATTGDLRAARERAEEANRFKSNFLAQMTHELRTPLNAVIGFSDLIQQEIFGPVEPPRYREYVGLISSSGKHLLELINDVLDLSKIEAGRMELDLARLDPAALAHGAAGMFGKMAADRGVELQCRALPPCRVIHGDERITNQIIYNLLSNAVKFTPKGGRVDLEFVAADSGVDVVVRDTGIGMSAAEIAKAMRPYGQIGSALVKNVEGTGLGLPLVKSLIDLHGGTLNIESVKGQGTRMTAHFPWQPALTAEPQQKRAAS
jgi:signal transduction histidine kinase/CHASE1-domain containing sensor protein/integral membrane sensor domain MASE1